MQVDGQPALMGGALKWGTQFKSLTVQQSENRAGPSRRQTEQRGWRIHRIQPGSCHWRGTNDLGEVGGIVQILMAPPPHFMVTYFMPDSFGSNTLATSLARLRTNTALSAGICVINCRADTFSLFGAR